MMSWRIDHPIQTIAAIAAVTCVFALLATRLEIDLSAEGFMVDRDPARAYYERIKQTFGSDSLTLVVVEGDDLFTHDALSVIRRLSDAVESLNGVVRVDSLTTARGIRANGPDLDTGPLVPGEIPVDPAALERLRRDALDNPIIRDNLVSPDGRTGAIAVFTEARGDKRFNEVFTHQIDDLIARESGTGLRLYQVGEPLLKATYARYLVNDLTRLIPLSFLVLFIAMSLMLRTIDGITIPMITAAISAVWGAGLMGASRIPFTVLTAAVPPLLITIGFSEVVHMLSVYHERIADGSERAVAIRWMTDRATLPVLVTAGTTILGFGSLALSRITMLRQFGIASAFALTANLVVTLIAVPALLSVLPAPRSAGRVERDRIGVTLGRAAEAVGWFNLRHRRAIWAIAGLLSVAAMVGVMKLSVDTDFTAFFPPDSLLPQRTLRVHQTLSGSATFYVVVEAGREHGVEDPRLVAGVARLQQFIVAKGADKTLSIADYLRTVHRELHGGGPLFDVLPPTRDHVAQYLLLLDRRDLDRLIDSNGSTALIAVRHNLTGSAPLSRLLQDIAAFVPSVFPPDVHIRVTGESILINSAADYMTLNEITSFSVTLAIVAVLHAMLFRSVRTGILSLIPNVIPIVLTYGVMGFVGIPLNTGTAMVATIAIGIAVDDTVHHVTTYSRQLDELRVPSLAMFRTLRELAAPLTYVSFALAAGFFVMVGSGFVPMRQFGFLASLTMIIAMACEIFITPILLVAARPVTRLT
jgi:predicted RND superfamily exporter protein